MILNQDVKKIFLGSNSPFKIVKEKIDIFSDFLCVSINSSIMSTKLQKNLKLEDIIPLQKKGKKDVRGNYRPVIIIPNLFPS